MMFFFKLVFRNVGKTEINKELPSKCIGTETSSTTAPHLVPNDSAASFTILSTSGSECLNPNPSLNIPIFIFSIFPVSYRERHKQGLVLSSACRSPRRPCYCIKYKIRRETNENLSYQLCIFWNLKITWLSWIQSIIVARQNLSEQHIKKSLGNK